MRILLLADISSEHTQKWALGLAGMGLEIGIFSLHREREKWYSENLNITILYQPENYQNPDSIATKILYFSKVRRLKKIIKNFAPDILHAHYATSYGLVGRLTGFHPFVISAWGTDVMRFPQQNAINRKLLYNNLERADVVCATSETIKEYIDQVIERKVEIIPFGVDTSLFRPAREKTIKPEITIGCVKSLRNIYRINILIKAFAELINELPEKELRLLIVGSGPQEKELHQLVSDLNISIKVEFAGKIPHKEVPAYFNKMDIVANLSEYESFGVSVIEAMACACAVVVTDTGGLREISKASEVGKLVKVDDVRQTSIALKEYITDEMSRKSDGEKGREYVIKHYNWKHNLQQMADVYTHLLKS